MKKLLKQTVCLIMAAAICICLVSCGNTEENQDVWATATYKENTELGSGKKTFYTDVVAGEKAVKFTVNTDKETVGEALSEIKLIDGEKGPYGLYVKTVNGILADYDKNGAYWAFTKNGESLMTGVDGEKIEAGTNYELTFTK